jgi:DNA-binding transcriptional MocR family regulator
MSGKSISIPECGRRRKKKAPPLSRYVLHLNVPEGIQLGFAAVNERAIRMGIRALAAVLRAHARSVRS